MLRKADICEVERIMEILADGRGALTALGVNQWQRGYPHRNIIEQDIRSGESYVVEADDGSLIATAMIGFRGEKGYRSIQDGTWLTDSPDDSPCYAVVHRVAVETARKGNGAASLILNEAERIVSQNGYESIRIETHEDNTPMRSLLAKEGYTRCGTIYITHDGECNSARMAYEKLIADGEGSDVVNQACHST